MTRAAGRITQNYLSYTASTFVTCTKNPMSWIIPQMRLRGIKYSTIGMRWKLIFIATTGWTSARVSYGNVAGNGLKNEP
nr:MAG TPA: hypothetical protein [Caudoviricetes sp.]